MEFIDFIISYIKLAQITDIVDIFIVSTIIYFILNRIRRTSSERLLKGVAVILLATLFSEILNLNTINYILANIMQVGLIAIVIIFQPEARKMLERMGKTRFYKYGSQTEELSEGEIIINEVADACKRMADAKEGALIVFEREDNIKDIVETGIKIEAKITSELVRNIFYPKAPLHDGAMVINNGKIQAASCILPLSDNQSISKDLGTRHRAAVGMTEFNDSICVIVSEETGAISVSSKGMLKRHLSQELLKKLLKYELLDNETVEKTTMMENIMQYIGKYLTKSSKEE